MLKRLVSLVVAAVVLGGCGSDQHADTSVLSSSGGLLISGDWTGDWEVFVMDPESPILHQVTHEGAYVVGGASQSEVEGFDFEGTWSPDGKQIALTTDRYEGHHIVIVDRDGQVVKRLTTGIGNGEPSWSPDGNQIAFRSDRTMDVELFVINVDGSDVYQLTQSPGEDWTPTWSPDGARLAFSSRRYNGTWDIFTTLPDGTVVYSHSTVTSNRAAPTVSLSGALERRMRTSTSCHRSAAPGWTDSGRHENRRRPARSRKLGVHGSALAGPQRYRDG